MSILIPILAVTLIGLICGAGLSAASHFMKVKEDERFPAVRECLPGANCGACGYSGCDGYAHAILDEGAALNLCVPGGEAAATALGGVMGVQAGTVEKKIAVIRCSGTCDAAGAKYVYSGIRSCTAARQFYGGFGICAFGCLGFGDCMKNCPNDAIYLDRGIAHVETEKCVGCGLCAKNCPQKVIDIQPAKIPVSVLCSNLDRGAVTRLACKNGCLGCKKCEKACPTGAIAVENNLAKIDSETCVGCGNCTAECPVGCISVFKKA